MFQQVTKAHLPLITRIEELMPLVVFIPLALESTYNSKDFIPLNKREAYWGLFSQNLFVCQ